MKLQRLYGAIAAGLMLLSLPARATEQSSYVIPDAGPKSMAVLVDSYFNPAFRAMVSCSWGSSAPANGPSGAPIVYQCWADTTTNPVVFKRWDGASWVVFGKLNTSTHVWTPSFQGTDQGTASTAATGTSGHVLGFLDGANTWSAGQTTTVNQNSQTLNTITNNSAGTAAVAAWGVVNGVASSGGSFGIGGGGYTGQGGALQNRVYIYANPASAGIAIWADGTNPINFYNNGTLSGSFSSTGAFSLAIPLALTSGGVGASTAAGARSTLGLVIGTNVQAWGANLDALSGVTSAADKCAYFTGAGAATVMDCLSWSRAVTSAATASAGRTAFGLAIGTDVQAFDAELAAIAGLTSANNKCFYWTGSGTAATFDCSSFGRSVANAADAAALRTLAGAVIGTNVQAWDADLDAIAALSSNGIVARTGAGTAAVRTLTAPAAGFTITSGDGVSGNPTFVLANDLSALEALASTGFAVRTTTDTWAQRTLQAPAAGLSITNPAGVAGDPTFALANDLAALEGLSGTGIARRTGTDAWSVGTAVSIAEGGTGQTTAAAARASSGLNVDGFTGHGDSAYSILATDRTVGTNAAFTASRTWTLPAANAVNAGQDIVVADFQGTVTASNTLVISRAGSDTVNGGTSVTISSANGAYLLRSDGSSKWTAQALGAAAAGGVSSVTCGTGLSGGTITTSGTCAVNLSSFANALGANVALSSTGSYFTGPSVAQGTSGKFFVIGSVTVQDTSAQTFYCRLSDGTSIYASSTQSTGVANGYASFSFATTVTNPAGNMKVECREPFNNTGNIIYGGGGGSGGSGNNLDSGINAFRIN